MREAIIYSTHQYTSAIANQLKKHGVYIKEATTEADFLAALESKAFDLIVLDSSEEKNIFELIEKIGPCDNNRHASILFLVPGKVSYKQEMVSVGDRPVIGIAKPFAPKEFANITRFLISKKVQHDRNASSLNELEHFAVMASHDLKTPIKNIFSYVDILLEDLEDLELEPDSPVLESAKIIESECKRMIQFVNDMYDFSSAGNLNFEIEEFDLRGFIQEIYEMLLKNHRDRDINLWIEKAPSAFIGDKSKLAHIFQNLFENAMKYSSTNRPLQIEVSVSRDRERESHFRVKDNGNGIKEDYLEKVFIPFKRGESKVQGTGIGLAIVRKLVSAHHGKIWVDSRVGSGSEFHFTLQQQQLKDSQDAFA